MRLLGEDRRYQRAAIQSMNEATETSVELNGIRRNHSNALSGEASLVEGTGRLIQRGDTHHGRRIDQSGRIVSLAGAGCRLLSIPGSNCRKGYQCVTHLDPRYK